MTEGRIDWQRVDATTEDDIARQYAQDEAEASRDAARFTRRVRQRLGLSQAQFSQQVGVSLDTIRNWEQGKRSPTGAAKALLTILGRAPEAAMAALHTEDHFWRLAATGGPEHALTTLDRLGAADRGR